MTTYDRVRTEVEISKALDTLEHNLNVMASNTGEVIAGEVSLMHPTLSAQLIKAVGLGVLQRSLRELADWKAAMNWRDVSGECRVTQDRFEYPEAMPEWHRPHPVHDGRYVCQTVIACLLLMYQPVI